MSWEGDWRSEDRAFFHPRFTSTEPGSRYDSGCESQQVARSSGGFKSIGPPDLSFPRGAPAPWLSDFLAFALRWRRISLCFRTQALTTSLGFYQVLGVTFPSCNLWFHDCGTPHGILANTSIMCSISAIGGLCTCSPPTLLFVLGGINRNFRNCDFCVLLSRHFLQQCQFNVQPLHPFPVPEIRHLRLATGLSSSASLGDRVSFRR